MKRYTSIVLVLIIVVCLVSCRNNIVFDDTSELNNMSTNSDMSIQDDNVSNNETSTILDECLVKNTELNSTSKNELYYTFIQAGNYLGSDLPNDIGYYYREITSFNDFCVLVDNSDMVDEELFEASFVLVIKRVHSGYLADVGFKNYDAYFHEIELDSFPIMSGTDDIKTRFDYIVVPKYKAQMNEDHCLTGELYIKNNTKNYYAVCFEQKVTNNQFIQGKYFKNIEVANNYLINKGYGEIANYNYDNASILLLCLNIQSAKYESLTKSCYLGFKDFNTNGSDIYITLERNIVNDEYSIGSQTKIFGIVIPNDLICNDIVENPNIHILVQDNTIKVIDYGDMETGDGSSSLETGDGSSSPKQ